MHYAAFIRTSIEEDNMRMAAGMAALVFIAVGCASSGPPVSNAEIAQAEADIRRAENATATQHARDLLDRARGDYASAQREWHDGHWDEARRRIAQTRAAANAAESKARATAMEQQAQDLKQSDDIDDARARSRRRLNREERHDERERNTGFALLAAGLILAAACATAPPTESPALRDARLALQDARDAGAPELATEMFNRATNDLSLAHREWNAGHENMAMHYAQIADSEARDAEYRARGVRAEQALAAQKARRTEVEAALHAAEERAIAARAHSEAERQRLEAEMHAREEQARLQSELRPQAQQRDRARLFKRSSNRAMRSAELKRRAEVEDLKAQLERRRKRRRARHTAADQGQTEEARRQEENGAGRRKKPQKQLRRRTISWCVCSSSSNRRTSSRAGSSSLCREAITSQRISPISAQDPCAAATSAGPGFARTGTSSRVIPTRRAGLTTT